MDKWGNIKTRQWLWKARRYTYGQYLIRLVRARQALNSLMNQGYHSARYLLSMERFCWGALIVALLYFALVFGGR